MKSFKKYLTEVAQTYSVKELIFGKVARTYVHIPLSLPMWKRITEVKDMYGIHSTDITGIEKLVKMQNSSAQISTADEVSDYGIEAMVSGVATEGGAVALMVGQAVFESDEDLYTYQDKQGRRWIEIMNLIDTFPTIGKEIDKIKHKIYKKLEPELDKWWEKEYGVPLTQGQFADLERYGQVANKGIRMFFDDIEKFLKKSGNIGRIKNAMRSPESGSQAQLTADWNENVLTKYHIETIILNAKRLAVRFKDVDQGGDYEASDVLAKLFPDHPVATDRESLEPFLEKLRKKGTTVMVVSYEDYPQRIKELFATAKVMNSRL